MRSPSQWSAACAGARQTAHAALWILLRGPWTSQRPEGGYWRFIRFTFASDGPDRAGQDRPGGKVRYQSGIHTRSEPIPGSSRRDSGPAHRLEWPVSFYRPSGTAWLEAGIAKGPRGNNRHRSRRKTLRELTYAICDSPLPPLSGCYRVGGGESDCVRTAWTGHVWGIARAGSHRYRDPGRQEDHGGHRSAGRVFFSRSGGRNVEHSSGYARLFDRQGRNHRRKRDAAGNVGAENVAAGSDPGRSSTGRAASTHAAAPTGRCRRAEETGR